MGILGRKPVIAALLGLCLQTASSAQPPLIYPKLGTPSNVAPAATVEPASPVRVLAQTIQPVAAVQRRDTEESEMSFLIQLTPPGNQRLFRFESEETLRERIRQEWKTIKKVEFPPSQEGPPTMLPPRIWPALLATAEPYYVCHRRLWFEQKNGERYGWDLSVLHPFISAGTFYADLALLPLNWVTDPFRCYDCNAGECLPGDAVPLLWYPILTK